MASTEDIEAKLAAYVDGTLDEAGRAEIEKHLASNPQHRQLIEELMQQRDLLRGLPREPAPADVADAITAQLERAVLLGDVGADADSVRSMRIGGWAQFRAIAAVLILTVGLAAAIYFLVPRRTSFELSDIRELPSQPSATSGPAAAPAEGFAAFADEEARTRAGKVADTTAPLTTATPAVTVESRGKIAAKEGEADISLKTSVPDAKDLSEQQQQQRRATDALASADPMGRENRKAGDFVGGGAAVGSPFGTGGARGGGGGGFDRTVASNAQAPGEALFGEVVTGQLQIHNFAQDDKSVVLVLATNDVERTNRSVTALLDNNKIKWAAETEPMPGRLELGAEQQLRGARYQAPRVQMKGGGDAMRRTYASAPPQATTTSSATDETKSLPDERAAKAQSGVAAAARPLNEDLGATVVPPATQQVSEPAQSQRPLQSAQHSSQVAQQQVQPSPSPSPSPSPARAREPLAEQGPQHGQQQHQQQAEGAQRTDWNAQLGFNGADKAGDLPARADGSLTYAYANGGQIIVARQVPRAQAIEICNALNISNSTSATTAIQLNAATGTVLKQSPPGDRDQLEKKADGPVGAAAGGNTIGGSGVATKELDLDRTPDGAVQWPGPGQAPQVTAPATTAPAFGDASDKRQIQPGDVLTITVPQLAGPGMEPQGLYKVSDGGTVALPMIDPVSVTGKTEAEVSDAIAQKYRDAKLIPEAKVEVALRPAPVAATQPAGTVALDPEGLLRRGQQATAPTTQQAQQAQPPAAPQVALRLGQNQEIGQQREQQLQQRGVRNDDFGMAPASQPVVWADVVDVFIVVAPEAPPSTQPADSAVANQAGQEPAAAATTAPAAAEQQQQQQQP